jgi:DNA-binding MarR family transcriptional regulator
LDDVLFSPQDRGENTCRDYVQFKILGFLSAIMLFLITFIPFLLIGCNLVWGILDFAWVARSPFRIAAVGLFTCASGFFIQTQIHSAENLPALIAHKIPMLSIDHAVLELFNKLVDVVIYAAGGGIIASALFLRAQLRFKQEQREQTEIKEHTHRRIAELERNLKFLEADALIHGVANTEQQRSTILSILGRYEKRLKEANRILKAMGEQ